ncbi:hypothetical protein GOP47_0006448 [Adiantum capillus-veneris]|uniref:Autophagy-related protein 9 n=1 Tax=Adiantum capillus-veneris TaxID=13818 RepID=A0A9D4V4E7_ADICA|nr:hypothetical protein GOP47_0006448 [Adiantum capillus-veneris]
MYSDFSHQRNDENRAAKRPWNMLHNQVSTGRGRSDIEVELSDYHRLSSGEEQLSPWNLLQGERTKPEVITDLDIFFGRLYKYYCGKGLWCIVTQWVIELLSLGFTICFSGFFLLIVDWQVLHTCGVHAVEPCDLLREAVKEHPLDPLTFSKGIVVTYLILFSLYWCFCFLRFVTQLREVLKVRGFYRHRLQISDGELQTLSWSALLDKIVKFQEHQRLCVVRELSAHDVVMRIMRRDNYLIGMVNKGVFAVPLPAWVPGLGPVASYDRGGNKRRLLLTKTLEWSLNWCVLQLMFDRSFLVQKEFINNPRGLRRRMKTVGLAMLLLSPFLVIFMFVYFFLRHAEEFYHHPSSATSRRWSNLARWIFREFNEMDHLFSQRLNSSHKHAVEYMKQFPSMMLSQIAKFVSFVAGGFAATLLIIAFLDESILEAHLFGRNLLWFAAVFGTITAISRSAVIEEFQVFEPERYLRLVSCFTHYMPKHWRGAENKDIVRAEFESLFQYTGITLLEELISIFVTPYVLLFSLPKYVEDILQFIRDFTVHIDGVGHVCSLSVFDFEHHGNQNYGSPFHTHKAMRSCQGKMEKSFLNFRSRYPHWVPDFNGKRFLSILADFQVRSNDERGYSIQSNNIRSLLMQPGYGFKWPLSCSNSAQEQFQSADLRGDLLFWANNLPPDQLYWLVDQYYTSHSCHLTLGRTATDVEEGNVVDSNEPLYHNNLARSSTSRSMAHVPEDIMDEENVEPRKSEFDSSHQHHLDLGRRVAGVVSSSPIYDLPQDTYGGEISSEPSEQPEDVVSGLNSVHHRQVDTSQWWLQQGRPSALTQGSFLEPPSFGAGHFAESSSESSHESDEDQERAWDLMHSRRNHASSFLEEKASDFDLPFGDVYDHTPRSQQNSQLQG